MGRPGFFRGLTGADFDPRLYLDGFELLAEALPGFGGLASYDRLTPGEVLILADRIKARAEREAAAYKAAASRARTRRR